ncbi:MAG: PspC domain-containing protein [Massilia sp.]|nr:PspC domain-containing protein [Massilia sp.]
MNISDEIKRLHELHQAGALSDAEFEQAKTKLLNASTVNLNKPGGTSGSSVGDDFVSEMGRLRRSRTDRWLGGVCGGIARVSGIDSWIWRLVFVLCTVFAGFGLLFYALMWIFVPEE